MHSRIEFSGEHQDLEQIALHHRDVTDALKRYFSLETARNLERFRGYSEKELAAELQSRLAEMGRLSALNVLTAVEAAFQIDYFQRCYSRKKKDRVSRSFSPIYKRKGSHPPGVEDILEIWKKEPTTPKGLKRDLSELKGAFNYRNWLAHGRYLDPKLGRKYDYESVYALAETVLNSLPFEGAGGQSLGGWDSSNE